MKEQKEALKLLNDLLSIPSVNGQDDERKIAEFICRYLNDNNVKSEIQYIDEKHANVIAVIQGESEQCVIWNGHLDTVPFGEMQEWETNPGNPIEKEGKIYARGASDMKSGLAAMVYLLGELGKKGLKPQKTIYFYGTCDEEKGGMGAEYILREKKLPNAELLLIGEPTGCRLGMAQKGCVWIEFIAKGITSHGAYPWEGCNAVEYGFEMFVKIKNWIENYDHSVLGNATAQITMVDGGIAPNMTPDYAKFIFDIRTVPGLEVSMILDYINKIGNNLHYESGKRFEFKINVLNQRRAIEISNENNWVKHFAKYILMKEQSVEEIGINYFTDASILTKNNSNLPVLLFGPGEPHMAHKANEYAEIEKYLKYLDLMREIFGI